MDKMELNECVAYMDIAEALIRSKKPLKLAAEGNIENAVACAMAEGFRMGWDAYKKKSNTQ
jgi:hypothetical protein